LADNEVSHVHFLAEVKMLTGAAGCSSSLLLVQVIQGISQYVVGEGGVEGWAAVW